MADTIEEFGVKLSLDANELASGLDKAKNSFTNIKKEFKTAVGDIKKSTNDLKKSIDGIGKSFAKLEEKAGTARIKKITENTQKAVEAEKKGSQARVDAATSGAKQIEREAVASAKRLNQIQQQQSREALKNLKQAQKEFTSAAGGFKISAVELSTDSAITELKDLRKTFKSTHKDLVGIKERANKAIDKLSSNNIKDIADGERELLQINRDGIAKQSRLLQDAAKRRIALANQTGERIEDIEEELQRELSSAQQEGAARRRGIQTTAGARREAAPSETQVGRLGAGGRIFGQVSQQADALTSRLGPLGGALKKLGPVGLAVGASIGLIGVGFAKVSKAQGAFRDGFAKVNTLLTEAQETKLPATMDKLRKVSVETGIEIGVLQEGLFNTISAVPQLADNLSAAAVITEKAAKAAIGLGAGAESTTFAMVSLANATGVAIEESAEQDKVLETLARTMKFGTIPSGEALASSISKAAPIFAALSENSDDALDSLGALTATLTANGVSVDESATKLKALGNELLDAGKRTELLEAGIEGIDAETGKIEDWGVLFRSLGSDVDKFTNIMTSKEARLAVRILAKDGGEATAKMIADFQEVGTVANDMFLDMSETSEQAGKRLSAAMNDSLIAIGESFGASDIGIGLKEAAAGALSFIGDLFESAESKFQTAVANMEEFKTISADTSDDITKLNALLGDVTNIDEGTAGAVLKDIQGSIAESAKVSPILAEQLQKVLNLDAPIVEKLQGAQDILEKIKQISEGEVTTSAIESQALAAEAFNDVLDDQLSIWDDVFRGQKQAAELDIFVNLEKDIEAATKQFDELIIKNQELGAGSEKFAKNSAEILELNEDLVELKKSQAAIDKGLLDLTQRTINAEIELQAKGAEDLNIAKAENLILSQLPPLLQKSADARTKIRQELEKQLAPLITAAQIEKNILDTRDVLSDALVTGGELTKAEIVQLNEKIRLGNVDAEQAKARAAAAIEVLNVQLSQAQAAKDPAGIANAEKWLAINESRIVASNTLIESNKELLRNAAAETSLIGEKGNALQLVLEAQTEQNQFDMDLLQTRKEIFGQLTADEELKLKSLQTDQLAVEERAKEAGTLEDIILKKQEMLQLEIDTRAEFGLNLPMLDEQANKQIEINQIRLNGLEFEERKAELLIEQSQLSAAVNDITKDIVNSEELTTQQKIEQLELIVLQNEAQIAALETNDVLTAKQLAQIENLREANRLINVKVKGIEDTVAAEKLFGKEQIEGAVKTLEAAKQRNKAEIARVKTAIQGVKAIISGETIHQQALNSVLKVQNEINKAKGISERGTVTEVKEAKSLLAQMEKQLEVLTKGGTEIDKQLSALEKTRFVSEKKVKAAAKGVRAPAGARVSTAERKAEKERQDAEKAAEKLEKEKIKQQKDALKKAKDLEKQRIDAIKKGIEADKKAAQEKLALAKKLFDQETKRIEAEKSMRKAILEFAKNLQTKLKSAINKNLGRLGSSLAGFIPAFQKTNIEVQQILGDFKENVQGLVQLQQEQIASDRELDSLKKRLDKALAERVITREQANEKVREFNRKRQGLRDKLTEARKAEAAVLETKPLIALVTAAIQVKDILEQRKEINKLLAQAAAAGTFAETNLLLDKARVNSEKLQSNLLSIGETETELVDNFEKSAAAVNKLVKENALTVNFEQKQILAAVPKLTAAVRELKVVSDEIEKSGVALKLKESVAELKELEEGFAKTSKEADGLNSAVSKISTGLKRDRKDTSKIVIKLREENEKNLKILKDSEIAFVKIIEKQKEALSQQQQALTLASARKEQLEEEAKLLAEQIVLINIIIAKGLEAGIPVQNQIEQRDKLIVKQESTEKLIEKSVIQEKELTEDVKKTKTEIEKSNKALEEIPETLKKSAKVLKEDIRNQWIKFTDEISGNEDLLQIPEIFAETLRLVEAIEANDMASTIEAAAKIGDNIVTGVDAAISKAEELTQLFGTGKKLSAIEAIGDLTKQIGQALLQAPTPELKLAGAILLGVGLIAAATARIIKALKGEEESAAEQAERRAAAEQKTLDLVSSQLDLFNELVALGDESLDTEEEKIAFLDKQLDILLSQLKLTQDITQAELVRLRIAAERERIEKQALLDQALRAKEGSREDRKRLLESQGIDFSGSTKDEVDAFIDDLTADLSGLDVKIDGLGAAGEIISKILDAQKQIIENAKKDLEIRISILEVRAEQGDITEARAQEGIRKILIKRLELEKVELANLKKTNANVRQIREQTLEVLNAEQAILDINNEQIDTQIELIRAREKAEKITQEEADEQVLKILNEQLAHLIDIKASELDILAIEAEILNIKNEQNKATDEENKKLVEAVRNRQKLIEQFRASGTTPSAGQGAALEKSKQKIITELKESGASQEEIDAFLAQLPAFSKGGIVPKTGPALLEKGELILPKQFTKMFRDFMIDSAGFFESTAFNTSKGLESPIFKSTPIDNAVAGAIQEKEQRISQNITSVVNLTVEAINITGRDDAPQIERMIRGRMDRLANDVNRLIQSNKIDKRQGITL